MYIDADFSDFNPEGFSFPPAGFYTLKIINQEEGKTKTGHANLTFTFEVHDGEQKGQTFKLSYNTGHPNPEASRIARENIARIYYGATGVKPSRGLNTADLMHKAFAANLQIENKPKKDQYGNIMRDAEGKEATFKSASLNGIKPLANQQAQPPQQYAAASAATPPWATTK